MRMPDPLPGTQGIGRTEHYGIIGSDLCGNVSQRLRRNVAASAEKKIAACFMNRPRLVWMRFVRLISAGGA